MMTLKINYVILTFVLTLAIQGHCQKQLKCYNCLTTESGGEFACKDDPKLTKVTFCRKGEVCSTFSYIWQNKKELLRKCTTPKEEHLNKCAPIEDPSPYQLPGGSQNVCGCLCDKSFCNKIVHMNDGWNACPAPGAGRLSPLISLHLAKTVCRQQNAYITTGTIQNPVKSRAQSGSESGCAWFEWHKGAKSFPRRTCNEVGMQNN